MIQLNLPPFDYQVTKADGKLWIFDILRKKRLVLTPEEWVRQHFIHYLIQVLKYPRSLIKVEGGLSYNQLSKRSDIVVFNRTGNPWMVIECKAPDIAISQQTLHQAATYNATLKADFLVVTNGLNHFYFRTDWSANITEALPAMPVFE
ncbi:MAG TPA: type I restriction enzyme HsdR N-terminal domain-containing protein [Ohtaekwangia sp.]|uniref:type I restriction enzyme HsdR N-terminal domain-containing protein n=1 Tax=Ohtaekwangia sp. TaxID=2066019 RepID=UPI002F95816E